MRFLEQLQKKTEAARARLQELKYESQGAIEDGLEDYLKQEFDTDIKEEDPLEESVKVEAPPDHNELGWQQDAEMSEDAQEPAEEWAEAAAP